MKKLLCLVFSLMLAVMAAGCGGGDKQAAAPQAGKTLRLVAAASTVANQLKAIFIPVI